MFLRFPSLCSILEENGFTRKSLEGVLNDTPDLCETIKNAYKEFEDYETLGEIKNASKNDELFAFWVNYNERPPKIFQIEKQEHYSRRLYAIISYKTGITIGTFDEVAIATGI